MKIKLLSALILYLLLSGIDKAQAQSPPAISSFAPQSAAAGASVTLTGSNFNTTAANNIVYFGAVRATVTGASATSLIVTVPANAPYGPISVINTVNGLSAYSRQYFTPVFSPSRASLLTAGDFTLTGPISAQVPTRLYGMASGDLDDDGKPELVLTNNSSGNSTVYIRKNTSTASAITFGSVIANVATGADQLDGKPTIADIDGDGRPDIIMAGAASNNLVVMRNTGTLSGFLPTVFAAGTAPAQTAVGDLDGDGKIDVVVANSSGGTISVFRNTSSPGSVSFAPKTDFATGGSVVVLTIADMNNDGMPDILAPRGTWHEMTVFQNTTAGGIINFSSSNITVVDHPNSVTAGDLDKDGDLDLVITSGDNTVDKFEILTNTSSTSGISFTSQQLAVGSEQKDAALADLNGDGKLDIVLTVSDFTPAHRMAVFTNTSDGTSISVAPQVGLPAQAFPLYAIAADMNSDGRPDLISGNHTLATISIYRNTLQYPPVITAFTPGKAAPGTSVTLTGSGFNGTMANNIVYFGPVKAEVTAVTASSLTVKVPAGATHSPISVLNTGTAMSGMSLSSFLPVFTPNKTIIKATDIGTRTTVTTVSAPYTVVAADFDGDGKPELLSNSSTNALTIHPNTGSSGTISFGTRIDLTTSDQARHTVAGDVDGDGKLDIAVPNLASNTISVFRNTSSGSISFAPKSDFNTEAAPVACTFADLDRDGKPELIVANFNTDKISILRNITTGTTINFDPKVDFTVGLSPVSISVTDIDGDSKPDVVVSASGAGANKIVILRNTGSGVISFAAPVDLTAGSTPWTIRTGDIDGDGKPDIVANSGNDKAAVFLNTSTNGAVSFAPQVDYTVGNTPRGVDLGDINGDGRPDMVVSNESGNSLSVLANQSSSGSISFSAPITLSMPLAGPRAVVLADLDGDSKPDITAVDGASTTLSIYRNILVAAPAVQASSVNFSSVTATGSTINWTSGSGASRIVLMKAGTTGSPAPVDETSYNANTAFGSGSQIGTSGWYTVYHGTGSSVTVSGLSAATDYRVMVVEYNGASGLENYQTAAATNNPVQLTTLSTDATLSALSLSAGTLSPAFTAATTSYSATVVPATTSLTVTSTVNQGNASLEIRVNGGAYAAATSGAASSALALNDGSNSIDVKVTAQDGTTIKTYTITVIRQIVQSITFAATAGVTYGAADFDPGATSTNTGIQITYVSSDPTVAAIVSGKVHVLKAGAVNITASQAGDGTYVAATDKVQALTISPKPVTLNLSVSPAITKIYDGTTGITLAAGNYILTGIETGDDATVSGTANFDTKNAGTGKTVTANSFVLAGAQRDNYTLSTTTASTTGSITAKSITLSLNAAPAITKTYDGTAAAMLAAGNYTLNGIEAGDAVTVSGTAGFDTKNAGTGKTITASGFVLAGAQKDNYSLLTTTAGTTGSILTKSVTLSLNATPAISKIYDGATSVTLVDGNYILSGIETGDAVTVSGTAEFDTKNAGTGKTVIANSFVLAGAQKDNYTLSTATASTTGSITAKSITLSLNTAPAITKTYDGSTTAVLAAGNYALSGVETGDAVTVSGAANFDTKNAGTGKTVTANSFVLAGAQKDNYTLSTTTASTTGSISAKSVTLSLNAAPAITKIYDGATGVTPAAGNYILNGIETGDAVTVSGTASFDTKNVGTGKTITVSSFVLAGAQKDNYSLSTTTATTTGSISAKSITLSLNAAPAITKAYDGNTTAMLAAGNYTLSGIETGDVVTVSGTAGFDTKDAGTGKTVTVGSFVLSGAQKDNYTLSTTTAGTKGTIEKKVLTVRVDDQSRLYGAANPVFTMSYSGFVSGEGTGNLATLPVATTTATVASAPGNYPIIAAGGSAANYSFNYLGGILTIGGSDYVNAAPTLDAIPGRTVCYTNAPQTIPLTGITAGSGDGSQTTTLSISSTNSALFSSLTVIKGSNGTATLSYLPANPAGGTARITVTVSDDGGTANGGTDSFSRSFDLEVASLPAAVVMSDAGTTVSKGSTVVLTASGGSSYSWAPAEGMISGQQTAALTVRPLQTTTYTVTVSSGPGCSSVQSITINVLDDYKLTASNFLTPNGDGKNDTWVIRNIDVYPNNQVTVFDAAGRPVYQKKGYTNSQGWGGDLNGSPLSEGSYFYVIDFGNGEQVFKGFITILKDR